MGGVLEGRASRKCSLEGAVPGTPGRGNFFKSG
jgi:hypothetical protein